jgi:hypothetical protein
MSKHNNSDFNWNEYEASQSTKQARRLLHNQLNAPVPFMHNLKEALWFIFAVILLTSPLWLSATGWIKG